MREPRAAGERRDVPARQPAEEGEALDGAFQQFLILGRGEPL
jgi:hypothetical protein